MTVSSLWVGLMAATCTCAGLVIVRRMSPGGRAKSLLNLAAAGFVLFLVIEAGYQALGSLELALLGNGPQVVALTAVVLIAVGLVAWTRGGGPATPPPGPAVAMTVVDSSSPVTATVRLTNTTGGTRIYLTCTVSRAATRVTTFRLMALGPDVEKEQIGSWQAKPGAEFTMEAVTHFARGGLSRLELVQVDGKPLLAYDVP